MKPQSVFSELTVGTPTLRELNTRVRLTCKRIALCNSLIQPIKQVIRTVHYIFKQALQNPQIKQDIILIYFILQLCYYIIYVAMYLKVFDWKS